MRWQIPKVALALLAPIALTGCVTSSGNPKLRIDIPNCRSADTNPLPPPAVGDQDDAYAVAARMALWGQRNASRARARDACEERIRERYGRGG